MTFGRPRILQFADVRSLDDDEEDPLLRSAVERRFEIIGEALSQLGRVDTSLLQQVPVHRRIIGFRNTLIHGYADIDHRIVWDPVLTRLPTLHQQADVLLTASEEPPQ